MIIIYIFHFCLYNFLGKFFTFKNIKDLNLLESNKIDTTDMKSINKGIKKFGYRFMVKRGFCVVRKIK